MGAYRVGRTRRAHFLLLLRRFSTNIEHKRGVVSTFLGDDAVADEVLLVGDEDDDIVTFGWSQILQT